MSADTAGAQARSETTQGEKTEKIYAFLDEDIQRARDLVGIYHAVRKREQFSKASPDIMRAFARGYGDDNPLFTDEDYGLDTRWAGQIAPPMINIALTKDLLADPIPKEQRRPPFQVSTSSCPGPPPSGTGPSMTATSSTRSRVSTMSNSRNPSSPADRWW